MQQKFIKLRSLLFLKVIIEHIKNMFCFNKISVISVLLSYSFCVLGMVAVVCNTSTCEVAAGRSQIQGLHIELNSVSTLPPYMLSILKG